MIIVRVIRRCILRTGAERTEQQQNPADYSICQISLHEEITSFDEISCPARTCQTSIRPQLLS
jgi:hypothetical protein